MKQIYVTLSAALLGGVAGWLIGDWLNWQIEESAWRKELGLEVPTWEGKEITQEEFEDLMSGAKLVENKQKTDYSRVIGEKESLADLAIRYSQEDSPYICNLEEWENPGFPYGHETILFYEDDTVFAKQDGSIFEKPQNSFGPNINLHFGTESGDDDVVYVCNPGEELYYEIIRMHSSYKIDVLGEAPPAKRRRKAAPKKAEREEAKEVKEEKEDLENADKDA